MADASEESTAPSAGGAAKPKPDLPPRQQSGPGLMARYRLAILASLIWLTCLAAYGYGYFSLFDGQGQVSSPTPTMNLLLFAFAAIGPLTMIWAAALTIGRASGLGQDLKLQAEAARRLTREVSDLKTTVDGQRDAIERKLASSLLTLEKQVEASATEMASTVALLTDDAAQVLTKRNAALEQALSRTENTISTTISQRFQTVDETLLGTADRIDRHLVDQLALLNQMLDARVSALDSTIADGQQRIAAVMEKRALGTDGYLSAATERMEGMLTQSSERLDQALDQRASALDMALTQQIEKLDTALGQRAETIETGFAEQAAKFDATLTEQAALIDSALNERATKLDGALNARAELLDQLLSDRAAGAETVLSDGATKIETALHQRSGEIDRLLTEQIGQIAARVEEMSERFEKALADNHARIDAAFARRGANLDAQNRVLETEIPSGLGQIQRGLAAMQATLAANPPVSDRDLAKRLGGMAAESIAPERQAIGDMVTRIAALEDLAREMLSRIDRTARLNEALDKAPAAERRQATPPPALPFADLAEEFDGGPLDWAALIEAMELPEAQTEMARALRNASLGDRMVAETVTLAGQVQAGLAEEGLFLQDLAPRHAGRASWLGYANGQRTKEIARDMAGIDDDVALTLGRARLRSEAEFRDIALRFVASYQRLVARIAEEDRADGRLVELAETNGGRAFLLMAQLTGAFERPLDPREE